MRKRPGGQSLRSFLPAESHDTGADLWSADFCTVVSYTISIGKPKMCNHNSYNYN